jgi:hypothetical protein
MDGFEYGGIQFVKNRVVSIGQKPKVEVFLKS